MTKVITMADRSQNSWIINSIKKHIYWHEPPKKNLTWVNKQKRQKLQSSFSAVQCNTIFSTCLVWLNIRNSKKHQRMNRKKKKRKTKHEYMILHISALGHPESSAWRPSAVSEVFMSLFMSLWMEEPNNPRPPSTPRVSCTASHMSQTIKCLSSPLINLP